MSFDYQLHAAGFMYLDVWIWMGVLQKYIVKAFALNQLKLEQYVLGTFLDGTVCMASQAEPDFTGTF